MSKGSPPSKLTGQLSVSSVDSPWWDSVGESLLNSKEFLGREFTIEELTALMPDYPNGARPRAHAVSRRLRRFMEIVHRGPNGSRSRGARYLIVGCKPKPKIEDAINRDDDWILKSVEKMTKEKKK